MKPYIIFVLLLAVIIPLTVKLTMSSYVSGGANTEPCMINLQPDRNLDLDSPVPSNTMTPQIQTDANETTQKINPFSNNFEDYQNPSDNQLEDGSDVSKKNRVGQKCEFGLCLPGK